MFTHGSSNDNRKTANWVGNKFQFHIINILLIIFNLYNTIVVSKLYVVKWHLIPSGLFSFRKPFYENHKTSRIVKKTYCNCNHSLITIKLILCFEIVREYVYVGYVRVGLLPPPSSAPTLPLDLFFKFKLPIFYLITRFVMSFDI